MCFFSAGFVLLVVKAVPSKKIVEEGSDRSVVCELFSTAANSAAILTTYVNTASEGCTCRRQGDFCYVRLSRHAASPWPRVFIVWVLIFRNFH